MLSPLDLQNKKVVTKKRKYDKIEMDEYLDLVFENYKELYNQNQELQKQIKTLSDGVQYYRSIESTIQKALVLAEKTSKETKDAAVLKAEAIEKDANSKASKIISEANQEYESIKEKCLYLVQQFNQYKMQLKQVATAQLELITSDSFNVYSPELDAIKNAKYSLPTTDEQENITAFATDNTPQPEAEFSDTTEVEMQKGILPESDIISKDNDIVDVSNDLTPVLDAEPSPANMIEDDMLTPIEESSKKQMDKTVILPDLKGKLDKGKNNKRMSDKDTMSILTADTIDLRDPLQEAQNESVVSVENNTSSVDTIESVGTVDDSIDILSDFEPIQEDTNVVNAQVKEADIVSPIDAGLQNVQPQKPEMLEPVTEKEKEAPTLDSLLQNMNLGRKKKKKGQEEDPFEFLGSVDDF